MGWKRVKGEPAVGDIADHTSGKLDPRKVARVEGDQVWLALAPAERESVIGPFPAGNYTFERKELQQLSEETRIALRNYDNLIQAKGLDEVELHWESGTLIYGDGGADLETLLDPHFT
jgi:hypothetical protein